MRLVGVRVVRFARDGTAPTLLARVISLLATLPTTALSILSPPSSLPPYPLPLLLYLAGLYAVIGAHEHPLAAGGLSGRPAPLYR